MKAVVALAGALLVPLAIAGVGAEAAPGGDDEVVAFMVSGVGYGHGRGMSQWGAYGRALAGQTSEEILAAYYGGTEPGEIDPDGQIAIRLNAFEGIDTVGVMAVVGAARWRQGGGAWSGTTSSIHVEKVADSNLFDVYISDGVSCATTVPDGPLALGATGDDVGRIQSFLLSDGFSPGQVDGIFGSITEAAVIAFQQDASLDADGVWSSEEAAEARTRIAAAGPGPGWVQVANGIGGPIEMSLSQEAVQPEHALGLCQSDGTLIHYRGLVRVWDTYVGTRTVNELAVEDYLRGVVPKEVPAVWGYDGEGLGINALMAQAIAARSFGVSQNRAYWVDAANTIRYATTCDSSSCQVYGGAARRTFSASTQHTEVEHPLTDTAIESTANVVRFWNGTSDVVSTEFSASNGPRTAGGSFPPVNDPFDDVPGNPNHRWTRIIDADQIAARFGLSSANQVATRPDTDPGGPTFDGIWGNEVVLGEGKPPVSAWTFRGGFGLPSPGFELIPIRRDLTAAGDFAFIGDSVGVGIVECCGSNLLTLTEGVFSSATFDALSGRLTQGGSNDGVHAAKQVPIGTDLVVVELGYNDLPSMMAARIDAVMTELTTRQVGLVAWVTVAERRTLVDYAATNAAIADAAERWNEMIVLDWESASDDAVADRWFSDGVHLTTTGNAEFAMWLRDRIITMLSDGYTPPPPPRPMVPGEVLRVPVLGVGGVPGSGVVGVALNVTAVGPDQPGFLRVWPCGSVEPSTSSVNYLSAGAVEPNAVVVPVDETGEVCISTLATSDVIVDVSAWFDAGVQGAAGGRLVDTRFGIGPIPPR